MSSSIHVVDVDAWNVIEKIASSEGQEHPFYVCDLNDIVRKYKIWKTLIPRVKPHYAVKCNDHPVILKTLASLGTGFDCASKSEMDKVLSLGVDPDRIIYAHTTKPNSHIRHAAKVNIDLMTFDNELELYKINQLYPRTRTVIRIKYDAKISQAPLGIKFGCDPDTEAPHLLQIAHGLGINVVGVSFHVGSGCGDPSAFHGAIGAARRVFNVAATLGYKFNLLDIGGGYPGRLEDTIDDYAEVINQAIDEFFPDESVRIISEPGAFFADSSCMLACNIHSAKKIVTQDPGSGKSSTKYMYYLNDGVFGSLSGVLSYRIFKIPKPLKKYPESKRYPSILWGPTCDSMDQVLEDISLPEMQLGDWLVFPNMGGYTMPLWTPFNGFEEPKVYSIINRNNWLLLHNRLPFVEADFLKEDEDSIPKTDLNLVKEHHYEFPESSFIRG